MPDSLRDTIDRLLKSKIEQRLSELVEERLNVILGSSGQPIAAQEVKVIRERDPETETYHNRVLIRRIRVTEKNPRRRVEVRCDACGERQVLSYEAWKRGGCRCQAHLKVSPESAAKGLAALSTFNDKLAADIKVKLLKALRIGDIEVMTASDWAKTLDLTNDQRTIGRAFRVLSRANNDLVITQEPGRKWRVERRA